MATGVGRATSLIGAGFAALGGAAIIGGIKGLVDEAREAEKIGRITEARIRSTGGAANVSAKDFDRLTTAISNKVGVDDDLIATGANMLLTFKGVRNEVGKGNDIFDQASKLAVDLAAGMNQGEVSAKGLETANIQLGKALEDPIRGINALRRSGVSFTAQQQEQIKTLVESGKTLDAQKIILKAVGEQFAGTARAAADPLQRLDVRIGNIKESIGGLLVPAVERAAEVVDDTLIPAAERWWAKHGPAVRDTFTRIDRTVDGFFEGLRDNLEPQLDRIKDAWDENRASLELLIGSLGDGKGATDAGAQSARSFGDTLVAVTQGAGKVARALKTAEGFLNELDRRFQAAGKDIHFEFVVPVIKDLGKLVGAALWANEKMIAGAATVAEALHLPMAKSLRKAEQRMAEFRRNFNDELDRLDDERVNVTARAGITWTAEAAKFRQAAGRMAGGGPVRGPGGPTSDLVPAWLSAGEFVVNAKAVDAIGLDRLQQLNAMRFARGGAVDPRLGFAGRIEGDSIDRMATGLAKGLARAVGTRLTKAMAASLSASDGRNWGSGSWQRAIAELRSDQVPFQVVSTFRAGARTAASGSVSYHALNRAVDLTG
ncbi:MAG TPA: hypothetical protein VJ966_09080, partial [Actinomycetes bacterium]|nr:hypothetical protein [Actinomycetes bacterium]